MRVEESLVERSNRDSSLRRLRSDGGTLVTQRQVTSPKRLTRCGLPLVEEIEDIFGSHGTGGFEFAALLAEEELAVGVEHGDGGDPAFDRNIVFLGHVEILVHVADINVDDDEGLVQGRTDFGAMESLIQNVAIEAPVATEDDEKALVPRRSGTQSLGDFGVCIPRWVVDLLLVERLTKARGGGALDHNNGPMIAFLVPALNECDEFLLRRGAGPEVQRNLHHEEVQVRLGLAFLNEIGGKIGETFGFQGRPEGELVGQREGLFVHSGDVRFRGFAVEVSEGRGVTGKNGSTPLRESRKGRGGGPRVGSGSKNQEKKE